MRDLPTGPSLLALAREVLLRDLLPLLPRERQLEARLVAGAIAVAEREAAAGEGPAQRVAAALQRLYGVGHANACFETRPCPEEPPQGGVSKGGVPQHDHVVDGIEESRHPEPARSAGSKDALGQIPQLWCRLAGDLRAGAFADDAARERAARAILWRLTLAKLRLANPRFVVANGFSEDPR